jgi:hypothetical protein
MQRQIICVPLNGPTLSRGSPYNANCDYELPVISAIRAFAISVLCFLTRVIGFEAKVDNLDARSKNLALNDFAQTFVFAFFPFILGSAFYVLRGDYSFQSVIDGLTGPLKHGIFFAFP